MWRVFVGPKEAEVVLGELHFSLGGIVSTRHEKGMPTKKFESLREACDFLEGA